MYPFVGSKKFEVKRVDLLSYSFGYKKITIKLLFTKGFPDYGPFFPTQIFIRDNSNKSSSIVKSSSHTSRTWNPLLFEPKVRTRTIKKRNTRNCKKDSKYWDPKEVTSSLERHQGQFILITLLIYSPVDISWPSIRDLVSLTRHLPSRTKTVVTILKMIITNNKIWKSKQICKIHSSQMSLSLYSVKYLHV